jgi:shikimate dehydrogenase
VIRPEHLGFLPDGTTRILGIVGHPLEHSLSPALQTAVLRKLERNLIYLPLAVSGPRLPELVQAAPDLGILGFNVTTPYKEEVARMVTPGDAQTARTGMVNTVFYRDGTAYGCGTDGAGILSCLRRRGLAGRPFGVLGFGATARSLVHRALEEGQRPAVVLTRRPEETSGVLARWGREVPAALGWGDRAAWPEAGWPLVWISTLPPSAGPLPGFFWDRLTPESLFLDMNYGAGRTPLLEQARARGLAAGDGVGPLCGSAALSLSLWIGETVAEDLFLAAAQALAGRLPLDA